MDVAQRFAAMRVPATRQHERLRAATQDPDSNQGMLTNSFTTGSKAAMGVQAALPIGTHRAARILCNEIGRRSSIAEPSAL
jgi:hypothetical protein